MTSGGSQPTSPAKRKVWPFVVAGVVLLILVAQCNKSDDKNTSLESSTTSAPTSQPSAVAEPTAPPVPALPVPPYSVVKETSARYDNRPTYLVVIDPVDPGADAFKGDVKGIVQDLARKNGPDFSAHIFDDQSVALGDLSDDRRGRHLIAMYGGGLKTALYPYSISWFPASFTDTPTVGQWVDTEEWSPGQMSTSSPTTAQAGDPWKSMPNDGTFNMGGVDGKNWGVWESGGARADDGCEWSIRIIDPKGPAIVLDEGTAGRNQRAQVAINPVKGENVVFVTSGCQPWSIVD